jgi:hypothetical protein
MIKHIDNDIQLYQARGFNITDINCDIEFGCIRDHIFPITLNLVAADGHVGEVERSFRTIKKRNHSTVHGLPFEQIARARNTGLMVFSHSQESI